jgi:SAM-dependent methyltransferase
LTRAAGASTLGRMPTVDEYRRQFAWRSWTVALDALPPLQGRSVLDLGCGVGDLAAELAARGARVIGVDAHDELLAAARARGLPGAEFRRADLRALPDLGPVDGVWASFSPAYFTDFAPVLATWAAALRPGGWIALTEIDDLFGHEPLSARTRERLAAYAAEALAAGRYDFSMGRRLAQLLQGAGCTRLRELRLPDLEFSCAGPARPDVLEGWRARLDGMRLLHGFCGPDWPAVRDEFLACLARPDHRALSSVRCCIATTPGGPP